MSRPEDLRVSCAVCVVTFLRESYATTDLNNDGGDLVRGAERSSPTRRTLMMHCTILYTHKYMRHLDDGL